MAAGVCFEVSQALRSSGGGGFLQGPASQRDPAISRIRTGLTSHSFLFDAVPFTPSQGVCAASPQPMSKTMFSPFASFHRDGTNLGGGINSDGSSNPELSMLPNSADGGGLSGYSPFMGVPWGNSVSYMSDTTTGGGGPSPLELPSSPMSPGVLFNPSPSGAGLGAPGSPCSLFGSHSPNPYSLPGGPGSSAAMRSTSGSLAGSFLNSNASAAADAAAAAAAAAFGTQLPAFYYQAAAAAAGGGAAAAAASNLQLQAALSQTLLSHPSAALAAAQQQQLLQASLSAALAGQANPFLQGYPSAVLSALEPMRSAGGSLSLDGGLQQQASVQAAAALLHQQQQQQQVAAAVLQQQHHQHAALRRNLSTPAAVAAQLGLGGAASAQLGLQGLGLSGGGGALQLPAAMGRVHVTHSADLSALDAAGLLGPQGSLGGLPARPKFKARKNSEPKIGPDGQPRLNARQRRTLRRAKERALKGLLEVSQALLQKAEVQVTVPNISHLTALEELAAVEAEKEEKLAAAGGDPGSACLSPGGGAGGRPGGVTRSQQLAAAAAAVEESVCEIARAAVAAVTAQATGRDTGAAAAAAQAAAAQAASAAASAGAVLPPGFVLPEVEEPHSEDLPGCGSDPLDSLSHSAPTSPVGSSIATGDASGRSSSSSSSSGSLPASGRCSSSGSAVSPLGAAKPPVKPLVIPSSPLCSPLPSPSPAGGSSARQSGASQLEGIDIAGLIGQLSLKKDEGVVDEKLIRDLQIIQSLIGALRAPSTAAGLDPPSAGGSACTSPSPVPAGGPRSSRPVPGAKVMPPKRSDSYSPGTAAGLAAMLPH